MAFDFSKTEAAQENKYLKPGIYAVKVTKGEYGVSKSEKKTPYVALTFTTSDELSITEKFMITEGAIGRLQYLHEAWSGKKLDKAFKTAKEVAEYFIAAFTNKKAGSKNLIVGGEINGKVTYGALPYTGFIAAKDADLGEFEENGDDWKKYTKVSNRTTEATGKKQGILNDAEDDVNDTEGAEQGEKEELPW